MTRCFLTLAALLLGAGGTWAQPPQPVKIRVVGLRVEKPNPDDILVGGTTLKLLVDAPERFPLGVEVKNSKLTAATDDKGFDLTVDPAGAKTFPRNPIGNAGQESWQGQYLTFTIRLPGRPCAGAEKIRLKGNLIVLFGSGEKAVEVKDVRLEEKGKATTVGPATLALFNPRDEETSVMVRSTKAVKQVLFFDAAGKEIPQRGSLIRFGFGTKKADNYSGMVRLEGKVEACSVRLVYFQNVEQLKVPLNLECGLGG
jgi:hypothetical protein